MVIFLLFGQLKIDPKVCLFYSTVPPLSLCLSLSSLSPLPFTFLFHFTLSLSLFLCLSLPLTLSLCSSGITTRRFVGHTKDVMSVAFSADNRQIVSGSRDHSIKLWNTLGVCKYTIQVLLCNTWMMSPFCLPYSLLSPYVAHSPFFIHYSLSPLLPYITYLLSLSSSFFVG